MIKIKKLCFILCLSLFFISCSSGECDLDGCERQGQGWESANDNSTCAAWGACKIDDSGGYCSKAHALKG